MILRVARCLAFVCGPWLATGGFAADYPSPPALAPDVSQIVRLQRTLTLLSRSTPERSETVRLLYVGQPFEGAVWWTNLVKHLRHSFPNANILAENRALDLHPTEQIIRAADSDLYPYRPDLVVLLTTGNHYETRRLVRQIRERTSADVLLLTAPVRPVDNLNEPTTAAVLAPDPKRTPAYHPDTWNAYVNYVWLPAVANECDVALVDIRSLWKQYLRDNQLAPPALIPDNVHFSEQGDFLMLELLKPWFELPGWLPSQDPWNHPRVSTYGIPGEVAWTQGRLRLEFTGNRVEVVLASRVTSPIQVLIDGRKPSEIPELHVAGRASNLPGTSAPALLRAGREAPLIDEEWTAAISDVSTIGGATKFKFSVAGSKTGPDGEGRSEFEFLSRSHRLAIQPADWNVDSLVKRRKVTVPSSFEVRWSVRLLGRDELSPDLPAGDDSAVVLLADGLENKRHVLELISVGAPPEGLKAVRIYRPARAVETRRGR